MQRTRPTFVAPFGSIARPVLLVGILLASVLVIQLALNVAEAPVARAEVPLDPEALDPAPVVGAGVQGVQTPIGNQNWRVKAFAQIEDRVFVGGAFLEVRELPYAGAVTHAQPFLAAFDLDSNEWLDDFTPTLDGPVWALEASPSGELLVGGEFSTVNGVAREGLVALDPLDGSIDPTFEAFIDNAGSNYTPSVRDFELDGSTLYVAGDFNRIVEGGDAHGAYRVGRVDATTGDFDTGWRPLISGGAVWDVAADPVRGKVHLAGQFTSVNMQPNTKTGAVVFASDASSVPGHDFSINGNWSRTYGVDMVAGNAWYAGEQHYMQIREGGTFDRLGCFATGYTAGSVNPTTCYASWRGGAGYGGDYQVVEEIDGYIVAGCHCRGNHWNSITQTETNLQDRGLKIYNSDGTETSFFPGAIYWNEGPYAAFADTNGCLYIGGDFVGNAYGFARYCQDLGPDVTAPSTPVIASVTTNGVDEVVVDWEPSTDDRGVVDYMVHRDYQFQGVVDNGSIYVDNTVVENETYRYQIRARDAAGNVSAPSILETITVSNAGPDVTPPSVPGGVTLATNGVDEVTVTWTPSTDDVGVVGYMVHRDYQYMAFLPGAGVTSFVDDSVVEGESYRYQVRAQDGAGNNSAPSGIQSILVSNVGPDLTPPTTPGDVVLETNGVDEVTLTWTPSTDDVGVIGYLIHRDYQYLTFLPGPAVASFVDDSVVGGESYRYQVRAQDGAGNNSAASPVQTILVSNAGPDVTPPSTPVIVSAAAGAGPVVDLEWEASTDDVGVTGYLVHRDYQYLAYLSGGATVTYSDGGVVAGESYRYQVRAQDGAGNNSAPSVLTTVDVP